MKNIFLVLILFMVSILSTKADVIVLPEGSVVTFPNSQTLNLTNSSFLLNRQDMEIATESLAIRPINEKAIVDLTVLSNKQEAQLKNKQTEEIVAVVVTALVAGLIGYSIR